MRCTFRFFFNRPKQFYARKPAPNVWMGPEDVHRQRQTGAVMQAGRDDPNKIAY